MQAEASSIIAFVPGLLMMERWDLPLRSGPDRALCVRCCYAR